MCSRSVLLTNQKHAMILLTLLPLLLNIFVIDAAKILAVIPTASHSHNAPFHPLWRELALRGHQVTVITTNPQRNASVPNLTEIDLSFTHQIYKKYDIWQVLSNDSFSGWEKGRRFGVVCKEAQDAQLSSPEVQELIHNKNISFDLVMLEAQMPGVLAFAWRFKAPVIGFTSLNPSMQYYISLDDPVHPIVNPDHNLKVEDPEDLTFKERLRSFIFLAVYKYFIYYQSLPSEHEHVKKYFGDDLPPLLEIQNNISMLFVGIHPIFHNVRPLNPNTIMIGGGMHLQEPKPLPDDLKAFLVGADQGAIFFSLGSSLNSKSMTEDFRSALFGAFSELPYRILMNIDIKQEDVPKNVMMKKWVPQQDILRHPNVKLFITQGGLQSLQEAITNDLPVLSIPFCGDQILNTNKVVKTGWGRKLDKDSLSKDVLKSAINEVLDNPKYKQRAMELGAIYRDEETSSLQTAVYWTEYVIRHKGASHLRSSAHGMPSWKYYMLDIFAFLTAILCLLGFVFFLIVKYVCRLVLCCVKSSTKRKND